MIWFHPESDGTWGLRQLSKDVNRNDLAQRIFTDAQIRLLGRSLELPSPSQLEGEQWRQEHFLPKPSRYLLEGLLPGPVVPLLPPASLTTMQGHSSGFFSIHTKSVCFSPFQNRWGVILYCLSCSWPFSLYCKPLSLSVNINVPTSF